MGRKPVVVQSWGFYRCDETNPMIKSSLGTEGHIPPWLTSVAGEKGGQELKAGTRGRN